MKNMEDQGVKEARQMKQALWTVKRLGRMRREGLTAEEVTAKEIDEVTAKISAPAMRSLANSALGELLMHGGVIADLFEALWSVDPRDEEVSAATANSVIKICQMRLMEIKGIEQNED